MMSNKEQKKYVTSDLSLAAFLLMKGLALVSAQKTDGKFEFIFDDPESKADALSLQFIGSEFAQYDGYIRTLRGMLNRN